MKKLYYQLGFGNHFATEAIAGALPPGQNAPQQVAYGLYAEQLSGSAFTMPRKHNLRSWLYRIRPSVIHGEFNRYPAGNLLITSMGQTLSAIPQQMRWNPLPYPETPTDFIDGLITFACHGNATAHNGAATHLYAINHSMTQRFFYNADGEMLLVPQEGALRVRTELGILEIAPGEIAVIPRGIKFQVQLIDDKARGYVCENYGMPFQLPELGPIGANGLANPRDFNIPVAAYEDVDGDFTLVLKFHGQLWQATINHSPLDVVAWHGNYAPYKYDLALFNTINTVSFDHPDPSIFTVLTSPSAIPGTANVDFVIFPPRWMVAEHTFRPPYFHRNVMSEFMGLIRGIYDAKETGFLPGGASLHNCMSAHGPDKQAFEQATQAHLKPVYYPNTMAFMFESHYVWQQTEFALTTSVRQQDYLQCWQELEKNFVAPK
jgi:homogentisate 1,2-dioxygenase